MKIMPSGDRFFEFSLYFETTKRVTGIMSSEGYVGLGLIKGTVSEGYDGELFCGGSSLKLVERNELAEFMAKKWLEWGSKTEEDLIEDEHRHRERG
jgi:hypothetical protein